MGHLQRVELVHVKAICMVNTRDVVHSANTWCMANAHDDHEMSHLERLFKKISTGTKLVAKASDKPLTRHKMLDACKTDFTDGT